MPWVPEATASISSIVLLALSYVIYARNLWPYPPNTRIKWYSGRGRLGDHRVALSLATLAFIFSISAVALAANPPSLTCRGLSGVPWQLATFHGFVAGYYVLQILFVPSMLWVTLESETGKSTTAAEVTRLLLWVCALLQIAAAGVLGDIAFCAESPPLLIAFGLQLPVVLWTGIYDGYVYTAEIMEISGASSTGSTALL